MAGSALEINIADDGGTTVVTLKGDGGVPNVDAFTRAMRPVAARHPKKVVFDLARLTFISSLLMGELVQFHRTLAQQGGKVKVVSPQDEVRRALQHARLDLVLEIED